MPIHMEQSDIVADSEVNQLWKNTISFRDFSDESVGIRFVTKSEVRELNKKYRQKDAATNVLTFSYPATDQQGAEHDVAVCLEVAEEEASMREVDLRDYVALLIVHAFLHITGMDHERSDAEAEETSKAEGHILESAGFTATHL